MHRETYFDSFLKVLLVSFDCLNAKSGKPLLVD